MQMEAVPEGIGDLLKKYARHLPMTTFLLPSAPTPRFSGGGKGGSRGGGVNAVRRQQVGGKSRGCGPTRGHSDTPCCPSPATPPVRVQCSRVSVMQFLPRLVSRAALGLLLKLRKRQINCKINCSNQSRLSCIHPRCDCTEEMRTVLESAVFCTSWYVSK